MPPSPILPPGATVSEALAADIRLSPGDPCTPTPPAILPALAGAVRDAASGRLLANATVALAPLDGQVPPSPIRLGSLCLPILAAGTTRSSTPRPATSRSATATPAATTPASP